VRKVYFVTYLQALFGIIVSWFSARAQCQRTKNCLLSDVYVVVPSSLTLDAVESLRNC